MASRTRQNCTKEVEVCFVSDTPSITSMKGVVFILASESVLDLKQKITASCKYFPLAHPLRFVLAFNGKHLQDTKLLQECGIRPGSTVYMTIVAVKEGIVLNTRFGQSFFVELNQRNGTIKDIKVAVLSNFGVPIENQILCDGKDEFGSVKVLTDDHRINEHESNLELDLIIVEDVEDALRQKDTLMDAMCPLIKKEKDTNSNNEQKDNDGDIDLFQPKQESGDDMLIARSSTAKYPIFLSNESGEMSCIFIHFDKTLKNQFTAHSYTEKHHCITAPPKLNGPTLNWNQSLLDQGIGPETILNVMSNEPIKIRVRCAYFADHRPMRLQIAQSCTIEMVKTAFIDRCELNLFDNIDEEEGNLTVESIDIFKVDLNIPFRNIIDKTVGNGLAYKNSSRLYYEDIKHDDTLLLVPSFKFKVSVVYKGQLHLNEIVVHSLETCKALYERICGNFKLDEQRILLLNETGSLKYNQWVESANLLRDSTVYVVDTVKTVNHSGWIIEDPMPIYIETSTEKSITLDVDLSGTVWDLKLRIQDKEGIPPEQMRLIFGGKQLEDETALGDKHIEPNATFHLILRLRGT